MNSQRNPRASTRFRPGRLSQTLVLLLITLLILALAAVLTITVLSLAGLTPGV